eukprot:1435612-Amphidinium_carterae.2
MRWAGFVDEAETRQKQICSSHVTISTDADDSASVATTHGPLRTQKDEERACDKICLYESRAVWVWRRELGLGRQNRIGLASPTQSMLGVFSTCSCRSRLRHPPLWMSGLLQS